MIATTTELDALREAGKIASNARNWAAETIKPGSLLRELQEGMETLIREAGAMPSFPAQTSRNHIAAHSCSSPSDRTRFEENDLVKIDVGAHIDGLVVDTGISADLSSDGRWSAMIGAASDALGAAIGMCSPGAYVDDIGERVEEVITAAGFRRFLHLPGPHFVARGIDHVLEPVHDGEVALLVHQAHVSRVEPAIFHGGPGFPRVLPLTPPPLRPTAADSPRSPPATTLALLPVPHLRPRFPPAPPP